MVGKGGSFNPREQKTVLFTFLYLMSKRIRFLPYRTIKQKIAALLVDEYGKQQKFVLRMPLSRQEMVDQPGVPGLPFPGKMIALKREGVIDFHKNRITISNLPALEKLLQ